MPQALANISPELVQAWDHMLLNEMYDFEARSNKQANGAFCIDLPAYDTGFIYGYWSDDFSSATTVMHEFGHYYDSWLHYEDSTVFNLDIAECYSQGLEVLLQEYYGDFTLNPANAKAENLQGFMNPLTYQVMLEDFQQQLYALDTFDTGVISQLYAKTMRDYGYSPFTDSKGNDYSWLQIPHLFDAPFYTISYFTSACVALRIWEISQTDWREAANTYLALIHEDQNQPFVQLLQSAGLDSPFDETTLRDVAYAIADAFDVARPSAA
jgi:oligoendopeptidase F